MKASTECIHCILKKSDGLYELHNPEDPDKVRFIKDVCKLMSDAPEEASAPYLAKTMLDRLKFSADLDTYYSSIKKESNQYMLSKENEIRARISASPDPIRTALQYAMIGNFIDFGIMINVDMDQLDSILDRGQEMELSEYDTFMSQLKEAKHLVYLLDNAGEIVLDKLFIETILEHFPDLKITAIVRGSDVYNDATMDDAEFIGLDKIVETIGNGTNFPGTQLEFLTEDVRKIIDDNDLILAKGQGNFESLYGCGKNIFYAFLCKCDMFTKRFRMEKYTGIFEHEERCSYE